LPACGGLDDLLNYIYFGKKLKSVISGDYYTAMGEKLFIKAAHFDSFWFSEVFRFQALIILSYSQP
jgi:hypothetical protein